MTKRQNTYLNYDLKLAHSRSFRNKDTMGQSELAGCFYCLRVYPPSQIKEYVRENGGGGTAVCPHCSIDSVLGSNAGYPLTQEFLKAMYERWFGDDEDETETVSPDEVS